MVRVTSRPKKFIPAELAMTLYDDGSLIVKGNSPPRANEVEYVVRSRNWITIILYSMALYKRVFYIHTIETRW